MDATTSRCRRPIAALVLLAIAGILVLTPVPACPSTRTFVSLAPSAVEDDLDAAWTRLAGFLAIVQDAEGLVPPASIAAIVDDLNAALDFLEQANASLNQGLPVQASASIAQAIAIMDSLEPSVVSLQAYAVATRQTMLGWLIFAIVAACIGIVVLLLLKRRHDRKKLQAFLDAEIDYSKLDSSSEKK
nr:hypothetical protein [Candidatus Sigynarchaeota archaeon]